MILEIILFILLNYVAGYWLFRVFFRAVNKIEKIFVPQIIGLAATPGLFTLFFFLFGFTASLIILPAISMALSMLSIKLIGQETKKTIVGRQAYYIIAAFIVVLIALFFSGFYDHAFSRITDTHFHASVINEIKSHNIPPSTPCLPGESLRYSWYPHLSFALLSIYANTGVYAIFAFYGIYLFMLFAFISVLLAKEYLKSHSMILMFITIVCTYFFASFFLSSTQGYALPILLLAFYTLIKSFDGNDKKFKILSSTMCSSLIYIHGLSFIFMSLVILPIILYKLIDKKIKHMACYVVPFALTLPFLFLSDTSTGLYLFQPFSGLFLIIRYIPHFNILLPLAVLAAIKCIKLKENNQAQILLSIITVLIFLLLFIMPRSPNIERNIVLFMIPLSLFTLYYIKNSRTIVKIIVLVLVLYPLFSIHASDITNTFSSEKFFSTPEYMISSWIKNQNETSSRLIGSPTSIYTGVSGTEPVICNDDFLRGWDYNNTKLKANFGDTLLLLSDPSKELIKKYNIKYFVFGDMEKVFLEKYDMKPFDFPNSTAFKLEYKSGNYTVYSVKDIKALPEKSILNLNFTSYSRWWEI